MLTGIIIGQIGLMVALITSVFLISTFKINEIDPQYFATSLGMASGIGAIFAMIFNPVGGAISYRTNIKFSCRRTWILLGTVFGPLSLIEIVLAKTIFMVDVFYCIAQTIFNFTFLSFTALVPDQIILVRQRLFFIQRIIKLKST